MEKIYVDAVSTDSSFAFGISALRSLILSRRSIELDEYLRYAHVMFLFFSISVQKATSFVRSGG